MTTFTASASQSGVQPRATHTGVVQVTSRYVFDGTEGSADTIQLVKVPDGAVIYDMILNIPAGVVAGSGKFGYSVGDGNDPDRFISEATVSSTAVLSRINVATGVGYKYTFSDDASTKWDTIDLLTSDGSSATSSITMTLSVLYSLDAE